MDRFSTSCRVVVSEAIFELEQYLLLYTSLPGFLFHTQMYPLMPHANVHEVTPPDDFRTLQCFSMRVPEPQT